MSMGLGCGLGCMSALSVTHSADEAAVCGLWHYICAMPLPLATLYMTKTSALVLL